MTEVEMVCVNCGNLPPEKIYIIPSGSRKGRKACRDCKNRSNRKIKSEIKKHPRQTSPICKVDACQNPKVRRSALCTIHKYRWERYRSYNEPPKLILPPGIVKVCLIHGELTRDQVSTCGTVNINSFRCKTCSFGKKTPNPLQNRKTHMRKKYKMSLEEYDYHYEKQSGLCSICNQHETANNRKGEIKKLAIDHCHKNGKFRSLLCGRCNPMIGFAKDNISVLESAIKYLQTHQVKKPSE